MKELCPLMPGRLVQSAAVPDAWEVDVLYHPDRPKEPGTGAIQSMVVDLEDWHKLPDMKLMALGISAQHQEIPYIADKLYDGAYGPYWLRVAMDIVTAAYMIGVLPREQTEGALRYIASNRHLQAAISTAHRLGVPNLEIYMIVDSHL